MTSVRQKANINKTKTLPYMELRATQRCENGSLLSHKAPLNGLRLMALPALADDDDGVEDLPELLFV
jgi:hypothetical protein